MGRNLRRFSVRLGVAASAVGAGAFLHHRWGLRGAGATLTVAPPEGWDSLSASARRQRHREAFALSLNSGESGSSANESVQPFDVLVVGGGATGLYTAVDAAQRGLKVALVEAADFGCGSTSTQPMLTPGAFPYVQRAIRQRDTRWLWRAYYTLESATIWHNTAPHCMTLSTTTAVAGEEGKDTVAAVSRARTLIPAMHTAELLELSVTAWLSTFISLFSGPLRLCAPLRGSSALNRELPHSVGGDGGGAACGGVAVHDFLLDGAKAAVSLARTAEALGVHLLNYAELTSLEYERKTPEAASAASPPQPLVVATVLDYACCSSLQVRTRSVINCAGAGADAVRARVPDNSHDATPSVFERFHAYSYLVVPRTALFRSGARHAETDSGLLAGSSYADAASKKERLENSAPQRTFRWLTKPGTALQMASTRYSFSVMLVTPWYNDTVLVGPSITPLPFTAAALGSGPSSSLSFCSSNGYEAQRQHIISALASCGVGVHTSQILSCLSTVVPLTKSPQQVPFLEDIFVKGYHVHAFSPPKGETVGDLPSTAVEKGLTTPFVHVYGGTPLAARRIAEEAVDTLIYKTTALPADYKKVNHKRLSQCRTRWLKLVEAPEMEGNSTKDAAAKLADIVKSCYVVHLTDLLARRLRVAYTSPAEAAQALPDLGKLVSSIQGWRAATTTEEVQLAKRFVESVAVQPRGS